MSFFSFTKKNKKDNHSLVFNIDSGSLSAAIINFTEGPGVDVLYYAKENFPVQPEVSATKHLELMKKTLTVLVDKVHKQGLKKINQNSSKNIKIEKAFYLFSSPWSISQTKVIKFKESKPFRLNESYLSKAIDQQERQAERDAESSKTFTDISAHGKIIEKKIIQIKANGYNIDEFNNERVKEAEISLFSTVIPENILQIIEDIVSKSFLVKNVWCHSTSLATFSVIRDLFLNCEDFIFLNVSEEMTDISTVKNGVIFSEVSFPFGRNYFIRELAEKFKVTEAIADSMIKMHQSKSNDELAALKFTVTMNNVTRLWFNKVQEVFNKNSEILYSPQMIFLVTTGDLSSVLLDKIKELNHNAISLNAKKINSPLKIDDNIFKINLTFLDKLYKI